MAVVTIKPENTFQTVTAEKMLILQGVKAKSAHICYIAM